MLLKRLLFKLHKVSGLLLSLLFLMWFLSGIVMIYHSFPKVSQQNRIRAQEILSGPLPDAQKIFSLFPDSVRIQALTLEMYLGRPVARLEGRNFSKTVWLDSMEEVPAQPAYPEIEKTATLWCDAPFARVDTLRKLDQWIPFGQLRKEFPIYKYTFSDEAKHQLYISSQSGKVLQFTDQNQRFWTWLGAIPHWVYFTQLRQNQPVWITFVKWASGIGCIMCLLGIILGIYISLNNFQKRITPYKKRWYRWHHLSGLLFGIFAITFALSGLMSLIDMPDWLKKKPKTEEKAPAPRRSQKAFLPKTYRLDYRDALAASSEPKSIRWDTWETYPYYQVINNEGSLNVSASNPDTLIIFTLTESMIRDAVLNTHGPGTEFSLELMHEYDKDYFALPEKKLALPVYRVGLNDEMHTRYYYNPESLSRQQVNDNSRRRSFLYSGLHSLHIKFLTDHPVLWNIVMYTLLIGGSFLSLTGVVLSLTWLIRKMRRLIHTK